jgi:hypothetical protein
MLKEVGLSKNNPIPICSMPPHPQMAPKIKYQKTGFGVE